MNFKALLAAAALSAVIAAPAQAQTLRWAAQNDILTLDPHSQNHATTNAIMAHAYEGLTRYTAQYQVEPALATKWTYISPTQVRFELRRGVKFHDGTPFTADDVVFSFGRIKQPQGTMGIYVTGIAEIRKIDDHTVDFIMSAPNPLLLRNIIDFRIMSKTWAEKNRTANVQDYKAKEENFASRNAMGTGSYRITGWTPEQRITMTVNTDWWDKNASNVKDVVYTPIKSDPTRVAALLSGDVDMLTDLPTQDVARLRNDAKLKIVDGPEVRTIFLAPDMGSPELKYSNVKGKNPFADKRVRQALSMAIDRDSLNRNVLKGTNIPAYSITPPDTLGYFPPRLFSHDVARARELLAEAGYPNGEGWPGLELTYNTSEDNRKVAVALQQMWKDALNIEVTLTNQEWKVYLDSITQMNFQIARRGWIGDYVDPNSFLDLFITGGGNNNTGFADPRYDDLILRQAPQAATDEARLAIFHEAEALLMEQMPIIPLYTYTSKHLIHPSVNGMPPNLMDSANFKYVWLDQDWRPTGAGN